MKDTSDVIIELRQILSEKLIPRVASNDSLNIILARRPLRMPPGFQTKRQPAPGLKVDGKLKSNFFLAQDKREGMHAIRFPYFCYVVEGELDMQLGIPVRQGKSRGVVNTYDIFTLPTNSFLLLPPGVFFPEKNLHWGNLSKPPADSRIFWLHILPNGAYCHTGTTRKGIYGSDNYDIFVPDIQLATLTEILSEELESTHTNIALAAQSALLLLLLRVQNGLSSSAFVAKSQDRVTQNKNVLIDSPAADASVPVINSAIVERACIYIQRRRGEPLDIADIANHAYVSPSHLAKLFRTELRTTIKKYVLEQRMEAARSMLTNTELSIQEISSYAGYMQPPQFVRVFKQVHHVTPLIFRQRHRHCK